MWKGARGPQVKRKEAARIVLHGNAEFEASDVVLAGDCCFCVPDGHRMAVTAVHPSIHPAHHRLALCRPPQPAGSFVELSSQTSNQRQGAGLPSVVLCSPRSHAPAQALHRSGCSAMFRILVEASVRLYARMDAR